MSTPTSKEKVIAVTELVMELMATIEQAGEVPDRAVAVEVGAQCWHGVTELCIMLWPNGPDDMAADVLIAKS